MTHQEATSKRRGRPPKAAKSAPQAPTATHVADDDQAALQARTGAPVNADPAAAVAKQLHAWLSSLARGPRHD
ncbi:P01 [Xanthomonas phage phiL7]|uniref:p01 n=1 Tax=Xanthomonas phage phiL7 TaxID=538979 RepID=C4ML01_9CAUD|nr:P01 [Xanthomonas phage phiL7]ACE75741.1 P01 [Xanthomonas phage phiL7]